MKTPKPKLIHCTFTDAHIEAPLPDNVHIEVEANANQHVINMVIWPEQFPILKRLMEQVERGAYTSEKIDVTWVPLFEGKRHDGPNDEYPTSHDPIISGDAETTRTV